MHSAFRSARSSNNAVLVVHCDGPLAPERIRRSVDRFLDVCPWPASRLRRPFPWGKLHWAAGPRATLTPPPVRQCTAATQEDVHRLVEAELNSAIDPRREPPLRFLVVDTKHAGALVLTWFHPLMDPRGSENLVAHLSHLDPEHGPPAWNEPSAPLAPSVDSRSLQERGRIARRSLDYMRTLAPVPPVSPGRALASPGPVRFWQQRFVERDPAGGARVTRETPWRLALVGKAMAELWCRRGLPDVPFMVPISVDLRAKGEPGPTFGNMLAFHFARFSPAATADVPALARDLRRQMADAVREGHIEANAVAMEFLKYRPLSMMLRALPWHAGGEAFSFHCADLTDFPPRLDRLFGRRVVNAYHVPAVLPRPGIGVFFNRCAGHTNLVVSWVEGAVAEDETMRIVDVIREGMGWISAP